MSKLKTARLRYVGFMPKEQSGIGCDVPPHVKAEWQDDKGRRCSFELPLSADAVEAVAQLPDADASPVERARNGWLNLMPVNRSRVLDALRRIDEVGAAEAINLLDAIALEAGK